MAVLIVTIPFGLVMIFAMYMCIRYMVLCLLLKYGWDWPCCISVFILLITLSLLLIGLYLSPDFSPSEGDPMDGAAEVMWAFGVATACVCAMAVGSFFPGWALDCRKMHNKLQEIYKMNDIKDWSDVKTNALRHIATYWYWLLVFSPFALCAIILAGLGVTTIGIRVLKYAHAELGAVIIFKDGNISLAGFPLHLLLSGGLGCVGGVVSFKILQWRKKEGD